MKRIPIFRPGKHTPTSGAALDFSESMLREAVLAYDPALHEAPIVVGHPKDNGPAYGWVKSLDFDEKTGEIVAIPDQVDADFAELVQAGRFKKRSASWYLPDSPANPKPGSLYLRHVGFLGAQPPALKGLKPVEFSEAEGVVEFSESGRWGFSTMASIARGFREWLIGEKGADAADKVIPNYLISDLENAAKAAGDEDRSEPPAAMPAFSEGDLMTIEELKAQVASLTAERDALKANQKPADFAERESNLAAREAAVAQAEAAQARAKIEARVDAAIAAGRLLPAQRKAAIDFAASLSEGEAVIDFGEGDDARKVSQREAYMLQLEAAPKVVDYNERAGDNGSAEPTLADLQAQINNQVSGVKA